MALDYAPLIGVETAVKFVGKSPPSRKSQLSLCNLFIGSFTDRQIGIIADRQNLRFKVKFYPHFGAISSAIHSEQEASSWVNLKFFYWAMVLLHCGLWVGYWNIGAFQSRQ